MRARLKGSSTALPAPLSFLRRRGTTPQWPRAWRLVSEPFKRALRKKKEFGFKSKFNSANIWMCWSGGIGELESVDHGWSRDSRCLSRRQGQIFSKMAKDWLSTMMFVGNCAGCARVPGSSSPFFL